MLTKLLFTLIDTILVFWTISVAFRVYIQIFMYKAMSATWSPVTWGADEKFKVSLGHLLRI